MISVIQKGTLPSQYRYRKTCDHCHTVFEFLQEDTKLVDSRDQRDAGLREIGCPLTGCDKRSLVTARDRLTEIPSAASITFPPGVRSPFGPRSVDC